MMTAADESAAVEPKGFHVPRLLRMAEIAFADGRVMRGRVFLPASAESHPGAMRIDEWLEEPTSFFPFLPDGEGRPVLLNKRELAVLTVAPAVDPGDVIGSRGAPTRHVLLECGALRFQGELIIDMPKSHSRVLDVLNRPGEFLPLLSGGRYHFVRKSRISRVSEPGAAAGS